MPSYLTFRIILIAVSAMRCVRIMHGKKNARVYHLEVTIIEEIRDRLFIASFKQFIRVLCWIR